MGLCLRIGILRITGNDDNIARLDLSRSSPVQAHLTGRAEDHVGMESLAVIAVVDIDLFKFQQVGGLQKLGAEGN